MTKVELISLLVLNFIAIVAMPFAMSRTHYKGRVKQCILDIFVLFDFMYTQRCSYHC